MKRIVRFRVKKNPRRRAKRKIETMRGLTRAFNRKYGRDWNLHEISKPDLYRWEAAERRELKKNPKRRARPRWLPKSSTSAVARPRNYRALRPKSFLVRRRMKRATQIRSGAQPFSTLRPHSRSNRKTRVNPRVRSYKIRNRAGVGAITVYVKTARAWKAQAAFFSEAGAIDYAKALHRANPRVTIRVSRGNPHKRKP